MAGSAPRVEPKTYSVRIFAHLDFNGNTTCNFACASCSHLAPFTKAEWMTPEILERDLDALKPFMRFDRVQAVGGEPLLHPDLTELLTVARKSGIAEKVTVITNGSLLRKASPVFWRAIDVLKLSVYSKLDPAVIQLAKERCADYAVMFEPTDYPDFYKQFTREKTDGVKSFTGCVWKNDCHSVHFGKYYRCPQSIFFHKQFDDLVPGADGLPLAGLTEEKLTAFLDRTDPLTSCSHCTGGHGETVAWHESKTKAEWIEAATIT